MYTKLDQQHQVLQYNLQLLTETKQGSGSVNFNDLVPGVSPTRTVYGQYRNLIYGSETAQFIFGTVTASDFWAISVDRARYKEHLLKGTFNLQIKSGSTTTTPYGQLWNGINRYLPRLR
jgi:hypothetical protein